MRSEAWECFFSPVRQGERIVRLADDLREAQEENDHLHGNLTSALDRVDELTDRTIALQQQLETANTSIKTLTDALIDTRLKLDKAVAEIRKSDTLRRELADATARHKEALRKIDDLKEELRFERDSAREVLRAPKENELIDWDPVVEPQFPLEDADASTPDPELNADLPPLQQPQQHDADDSRSNDDDSDDDWLRTLKI